MIATTKQQKPQRKINVSEICTELQRLARHRNFNLKSRIMIENRTIAGVASALGYGSDLSEADRKKKFQEARDFIKRVMDGEVESEWEGMIRASQEAIQGFDDLVIALDKEMLTLAKKLPIAKWVQEDDRAGFGLKSLAVMIGETGDLANYANPGKVWRRLGLAPFTKNNQTLMGSTWRSKKGLTATDWESFGYSPRRRSVAYIFGENLVKQNHGKYRERYDTVKKKALKEKKDWTRCPKCEGTKMVEATNKKKKVCGNCKGTGKVKKRCHLHAMLLATKLLIKDIWIVWNPSLVQEQVWD